MNVTVCSGTKAKISCGYAGANPFKIKPNWRIIKRNNNGSVISNVIVSADDVFDDKIDGLEFIIVAKDDTKAKRSYLSVGPVNDTYNNTSYQCIFTINDTIIESDTAGTITVIGMYAISCHTILNEGSIKNEIHAYATIGGYAWVPIL